MAREILKKQNVTFYKEDEQLLNFIIELSEKERRPVQNLILTILEDYMNGNARVVEKSIPVEEPTNEDVYVDKKATLRNLMKK